MVALNAVDTEFGVGSGRIAITSPACNGREDVITDCREFHDGLFDLCDHNDDVAVTCLNTPCTSGEVRLVDGATENEGRVEVCRGDFWTTVCSIGWDSNEADIVCRNLGYNQSECGAKSVTHYMWAVTRC